jgi:hypothetical protein
MVGLLRESLARKKLLVVMTVALYSSFGHCSQSSRALFRGRRMKTTKDVIPAGYGICGLTPREPRGEFDPDKLAAGCAAGNYLPLIVRRTSGCS